MPLWSPGGRGLQIVQRKESGDVLEWEHMRVSDREGIISVFFYRPGHCTCRWVEELRWNDLEEGKQEGVSGSC